MTKKLSPEHIESIRRACVGNKWNVGKTIPVNVRAKMSRALLGVPKTESHRNNIRIAKLGIRNPVWRGGVTKLRHAIRKLPEYREWRSIIFARDAYTCQSCSRTGGQLHVDHYPISYRDIIINNELKTIMDAIKCDALWDAKNGRTLCIPCHKKTDNYGSKSFVRQVPA